MRRCGSRGRVAETLAHYAGAACCTDGALHGEAFVETKREGHRRLAERRIVGGKRRKAQETSGKISDTREQIAARWWILESKELLAEVLNLSGLDTDANGEVLPVAEDLNLGGQPHAISFSQRLDETIGATDCHLNGARVVLQHEGGIPTPPS